MGILETLKKFGAEIGLSATDPKLIIAHLIRLALEFVGIILVLMILSAGVSFMFSGGEKEKIDKAKKTLFNAFVGLMIILSAYSIVSFVLNAVGKETVSSSQDFYTNSTTISSCIPQPYTGQDRGNSSLLANGIVSLNIVQSLDNNFSSDVKGIKVSNFQLNGPWNSCDVLKKVTVHHLGTGFVSDIDKIYITDGLMNVLTPVQSFFGNQSTTLVLNSPYVIDKDSENNFFIVINTAMKVTTGTHQIAVYPGKDGESDFVFSPVGHIVEGAENIISDSFTIIP